MTIKKFLVAVSIIGALALSAQRSHAAMTPTLSFSSQSSTSVTAQVQGDANSAITFYYYSAATGLSNTLLGTTDGSGNFSTVLNPLTYNLSSGQPAYVMVDGIQSQNTFWPTPGTSSGTPAPTTTTTSNNTTQPALTSLTLSSTNANGSFVGGGSVISVSFSSNQNLNAPTILIAGQRINANGTGSGPYSVSYTTNGYEGSSIPLTISLPSSTGAYNQVSFSIGANNAPTVPTPIVATPSGTTGSSASNFRFTLPLAVGMTNADVKALQQRLADAGLFSGPISGFFGTQTEAAVKKYQTKHNLTPLGSVGPNTRALLNSSL